jgi:RNA polymerase sigma factor (sigma-70 family)
MKSTIPRPRKPPGIQPETSYDPLPAVSKILQAIDEGAPVARPNGTAPQPKGTGLLSQADEHALASAWLQSGDHRARNLLVTRNQGLVGWVIKHHFYTIHHVEYTDMWQAGLLGLFRATETFDPDAGTKFNTYAVPWVRALIQKELHQALMATTQLARTVWENTNVFHDSRGGDRTHLASLSSFEREPDSFGKSAWDDTHEPQDQEDQAVAAYDANRLLPVVQRAIGRLSKKRQPVARAVIEHKWMSDEPKTLMDIGNHTGFSREAVRIIEVQLKDFVREEISLLDARVLDHRVPDHGVA